MSNYTTEVRFICETEAGLDRSTGETNVEQVLNGAWRKVFSFDFPIYKEEHREELCKKILRTYYTREIGEETVGLWKLRLNTRLNNIMPYYNRFYEEADLKFDPFRDVDLWTEREGSENETTGEQTNGSMTSNGSLERSTSNTREDAFNDTPQGRLVDTRDLRYLTTFEKIDDNGSQHDATTGKNISEGTRDGTRDMKNSGKEHVSGKRNGKTYSEALLDYRKTYNNIDLRIINELKDLFIQLWM